MNLVAGKTSGRLYCNYDSSTARFCCLCSALTVGLARVLGFQYTSVSPFHPASVWCVSLSTACCRSEVRVLVKDKLKTKQEFGPYVKPVQGDANNADSLRKVMKGAKSVVICGPVGQSARAAAALGLQHIVLPSALGACCHTRCRSLVSLPQPNRK